jgi:hypothetical protein
MYKNIKCSICAYMYIYINVYIYIETLLLSSILIPFQEPWEGLTVYRYILEVNMYVHVCAYICIHSNRCKFVYIHIEPFPLFLILIPFQGPWEGLTAYRYLIFILVFKAIVYYKHTYIQFKCT